MTVHRENTTPDDTIGDADLILRVRSGDKGAFGELWRRHYPSGMAVARSVTSSIDPDDLVQESYTRIYQAILKGGGPNGSFRAYLFTSIRNTAAAWGRARRETAIDELDTVADPDSTEHATNEALDRSLTAQAFRSLPSRWQEVLWYTEIEQMKPQEVAPLLGMKAGAVSQLAFRAREGLREAWIQAHLRSASPGSECQWTIEHLGAYSRGNLATRDHRRLELHLDECARCMIVAAEAKDVSKRLALVLLPLVLGATGASGYLAALQGGAPVLAVAGMSSTIPGAVFVGDGGIGQAAAATSGAGAAGSGAGSAGGAGSGASTGGVFTGMGAVVGAGSAALVVAGVVAAAAIVPGLAGANPATSLPSASDTDPSSIATDIAPDSSLNLDEPVVIETPENDETPAPPAEEETAPPVSSEAGPDTAPAVPDVPAALPEATQPPVVPENPDTSPKPPGEPSEPSEPTIPTDPPTWSTAAFWLDDKFNWHYVVPVAGAPGTIVQALLGGEEGGRVVLGDDGTGTIELRPSWEQFWQASLVPVTFRYVLPSGADAPSAVTTLYALQPEDAAADQRAAAAAPVEQTAVVIDEAEPVTAPVEAPAPAASEDTATPADEVEAAPAPVEPAPAEPAPAAEAAPAPEAAPAADAAPAAPAEEAPATEAPAPTEDAPVAE
ncbi:sigma-70 family RNA polymerase sigma factor [Microbacterium sp. NRRL B-14842]|uniref:sigma-70 family RNA polymerase sigma factor n=1 Tax=Microbacterium sp. NRRL B-14842 TaxID=3162881 RepID=UPI0035174D15